jgi:hypothetical protein
LQNPVAIISLELGAALLYWLVFVVVETATLQLVNWGDFQHCLKASTLANLASALVVAFSLIWIPRFELPGLAAGLLLTIGIEGIVLTLLNSGVKRINWLAATVANLVSFLILILPVFLISRRWFG